MDPEQFSQLDKKLNVLIGLLAINLTQDKTLQERVELLYSLGLEPTTIAKILGKTRNNIDQILHRVRKKLKGKIIE